MKKAIPYILATIMIGFGLLTLFLSTSVIFDLFGIRAKEGNYVLFVVWSNFISSILYLFSAYGFVKHKGWTTKLLGISTLLLLTAFIGLLIHVNSGGIYEVKTIKAMIFRMSVTFVFAIMAYYTITKVKNVNKITILIPVLSLFFAGCDYSTHQASKEQMRATSKEEVNPIRISEDIELNNGQKWIVDKNMMVHIRNMENDVLSFSKSESKNYEVLSQKLQSNLDLLTSNCTMQGKAHDELHKWLLPFIDLVEVFKNTDSEAEAINQFEKIQESFKTFNQYFQ